MALANTNVTLDALLKELYSTERVTNTLFRKNVLLGMLPKSEDVTGRHYNWPIVVASGAARSAAYSEVAAAEALSGEVTKVFQIALTENFANANVSSRAIAETSNDKGAFLRAVSFVADNQLRNFGNDVAIAAYRSSDGNRGQVGSIGTPSGGVANSQVTMKVIDDILNIEVGMTLDAFTAKTGGSQRAHGANGHALYVKAVDYTAGTFLAGNLPTPGATSVDATGADGLTSLQANDYLFVAGDRGLKLHGFQDWIPYGGPAVADSFFGVDRTTSPTMLAGNWLDGTSGASLASVLEDGISKVGRIGGELSHYLMSYGQFNALAKELGSKAQLVNVSLNAQVGYEGIKIAGATGAVICMPDRACPSNTICGMNMETWEMLSIGPAVHVWDMDGKVWLRTPNDSGMQIRFHSLVEMLCKDPRQNCNIRVTPV